MTATTTQTYEYHTPVGAYRCPDCRQEHLAVVRGDPSTVRLGCAYCPNVSKRHALVGFGVLDVPPASVGPTDDLADYDAVDEARYDDYRAVEVDGLAPSEQADRRGVASSTVRANVARAKQAITM